jgi:hypothetical protein
VSSFSVIANAELFSSVEDAVKYDFCYYIPYIRRNVKRIAKEDEWVKKTLARDEVIRNLRPKELRFNLIVKSKILPLKAKIDMLVVTDSDHIPAFPKSVSFLENYDWKLELVGKAVLLDELLDVEISRVLVYLFEVREWIELPIFPAEKRSFILTARRMKDKRSTGNCNSCDLRDACSVLPGWI